MYMNMCMRNKVFKTNDLFDTNFQLLQATVKYVCIYKIEHKNVSQILQYFIGNPV